MKTLLQALLVATLFLAPALAANAAHKVAYKVYRSTEWTSVGARGEFFLEAPPLRDGDKPLVNSITESVSSSEDLHATGDWDLAADIEFSFVPIDALTYQAHIKVGATLTNNATGGAEAGLKATIITNLLRHDLGAEVEGHDGFGMDLWQADEWAAPGETTNLYQAEWDGQVHLPFPNVGIFVLLSGGELGVNDVAHLVWLLPSETIQPPDEPIQVDTPFDEIDGDYSDSNQSLREALHRAGMKSGPVEIPVLIPGPINLELGELTIPGSNTGLISLVAMGETVEINARDRSRILTVPSGKSLLLAGFKLQDGKVSDENGGAILNHGNLEAIGVDFWSNQAEEGGAVMNHGAFIAQSCRFRLNTTKGDTGALTTVEGASTALRDCDMTINLKGGRPPFTAEHLFVAGELDAVNCIFAGLQNAVHNKGRSQFNHCTFAQQNYSQPFIESDGAGSSVHVDHCMFGTHDNHDIPETQGVPILKARTGTIRSLGFNLIPISGDEIGGPGDLHNQIPSYKPSSTAQTLALMAYSRGVNEGDPLFPQNSILSSPPTTDISGRPRVSGVRIDIGAIEVSAERQFVAEYVNADENKNGVPDLIDVLNGIDPAKQQVPIERPKVLGDAAAAAGQAPLKSVHKTVELLIDERADFLEGILQWSDDLRIWHDYATYRPLGAGLGYERTTKDGTDIVGDEQSGYGWFIRERIAFGGDKGFVRLKANLLGDPGAPIITSPSNAEAITSGAFSYQIEADGATSFTAEGLPEGLMLGEISGEISGTPSEIGEFVVTITASNAAGTSAAFVLTLSISPDTSLEGLVAWYRFDGDAQDASGNGNHGTPGAGALEPQLTTSRQGQADSAYRFDGRSFIQLSDPLPIGSSDNTVAVWVNIPPEAELATSRVGIILGNFVGLLAGTPNANWEIDTNGRPRLWWNNGQINHPAADGEELWGTGWRHVAWVRDKTANEFRIYVDGSPLDPANGAGSDIDFTGYLHRIGGDNRDANGGPGFQGDLDDLRIYDRALTTAEIQVLAADSGPVQQSPVITSVLTAAGQVGEVFTYSIEASENPASYDATGLPNGLSVDTATGVISGAPTEAGVFQVALTATNGAGTGSAELSLTVAPAGGPEGMVAWYKFDGDAQDASGQDNHGTLGAGELEPQLTVDRHGQADSAYQFDGRSFIHLSQSLPIGSSDNTVSVWVNIPPREQLSNSRVGVILGNYRDNPHSNWEIFSDGTTRLYWNSGQIDQRRGEALWGTGWRHLAWVRDRAAGQFLVYLDGVAQAPIASAGNDLDFTGLLHRIGGDNRDANGGPGFQGDLDDLRIYDRALTAAEVQALATE